MLHALGNGTVSAGDPHPVTLPPRLHATETWPMLTRNGDMLTWQVDALVLDDSFLRYIAASRCSVAVMGQPFDLFNQASSTFRQPRVVFSVLPLRADSECPPPCLHQPVRAQAVAFRSGLANPALVDAYNAALVSMQESGQTAALMAQWVNPNQAGCKTSLVGTTTTRISFNQVRLSL